MDGVVKPISSLPSVSFFYCEIQLCKPWLIFRSKWLILLFGDIDRILAGPRICGAAVDWRESVIG